MRSLCKNCGERPVAINYRKEGKVFYRSKCDHCAKGRHPGKPLWYKAGYRKKMKCDHCGFVGQHQEQFSVYYADGNPKNWQFELTRRISNIDFKSIAFNLNKQCIFHIVKALLSQ